MLLEKKTITLIKKIILVREKILIQNHRFTNETPLVENH